MSTNALLAGVVTVFIALALLGTNVRAEEKATSLLDDRKGHVTRLVREETHAEPLGEPPAQVFSKVSYPGPLGQMAAYVTPKPEGDQRLPAMVWITGGFPPGGIGSNAWEPVDPDNDQSARAFRHAGMVLMVPTLRGSFGNPGQQESFYGEVDDVIAAASWLAKLDYVDPKRIYLGGHSTGGTLALLVAASSKRFKGVYAFGPVEDPATYGAEVLTYDPSDAKETRLRAPIRNLRHIQSPTLVIEGVGGNIDSLRALETASRNPKLSFAAVDRADHFDVLAPTTRLLAKRLAGHEGAEAPSIPVADIQSAFDDMRRSLREADDLETLARLRRSGADLATARTQKHFLLARTRDALPNAAKAAAERGFDAKQVGAYEDSDGDPYYVLFLRKKLVLGDLPAVFRASADAAAIAARFDLTYDGWGVDPPR